VYKNFKRFVLAMQPILVKNKELSVICTGPLLNQDELNYLDIIGLGNRFTSVMCANDSELKWFYENAICFVFPSLYEGFGFPLLEAFASNCPIVSSAGGSLPEVGGDACIYFNPMDIDDMREKILFTIENKGIRDEMSRKGALRLTEYSLEKTLALTRQSYLTALSDY
jgi:glycosyltransferase involved in cell wall biosynthesis